MVKIKYLILLTFCVFVISCKKDEFKTTLLASLKVVNTVAGGASVKMASMPEIVYNNSAVDFTLFPGSPEIYIYPENDSLQPYYVASKGLVIKERESYSLFLGGIPGGVEAVWVNERIPFHTDNVVGVRFINLSPDSPPVVLVLASTPDENIFTNIAYKEITDFKQIQVTGTSAGYTFEVRNSVTGDLIASSYQDISLFKNITLVLQGLVGGSPAADITRVNH
jgi:hypothetical protein